MFLRCFCILWNFLQPKNIENAQFLSIKFNRKKLQKNLSLGDTDARTDRCWMARVVVHTCEPLSSLPSPDTPDPDDTSNCTSPYPDPPYFTATDVSQSPEQLLASASSTCWIVDLSHMCHTFPLSSQLQLYSTRTPFQQKYFSSACLLIFRSTLHINNCHYRSKRFQIGLSQKGGTRIARWNQ